MLTPINTTASCNGGFKWEDELGFKLKSYNFNVLLDQVKERLISRGLYIGTGWQDEVIDKICRLSNLECVDKEVKVREITWNDFEQFTRVAARHFESGGETVPIEEAERRASICIACPHNKTLRGVCSVCAGLMTWSVRLGGNYRTSQDENLFACGICGCANRLAIHLTLETLKDERFPLEAFPQNCWKKPKE